MSVDPPNGYWIQAPDNVVEASFSAAPDDVSVASIRILANPATPDTLHHLEIEVAVHPGSAQSAEQALTANPRSIVGQALDHADWEVSANGNGVFTATPMQPLSLLNGRDGWVFYLRDIDVIDRVGDTAITIREYRTADPTVVTRTETLKVRKIQPKLRIDYFTAIDTDASPGSHSTVSGPNNVRLSWATTGATKVTLYGPAGAVNLGTGADADYLDHTTPTLTVDTTSTFTLVAEGSGGHAVEQLTVTITNQTKVNNLFVDGQIHGGPGADDAVEFADAVTMKKNLQVDGQIHGGPGVNDAVVMADDVLVLEDLEVHGDVALTSNLRVDGEIRGGPGLGDDIEFADTVRIKKGLTLAGGEPVTGLLRLVSGQGMGEPADQEDGRLRLGRWTIANHENYLFFVYRSENRNQTWVLEADESFTTVNPMWQTNNAPNSTLYTP